MKALAIAALSVILIGCSTEFRPYEGPNSVRRGSGGTKQTVEGIDFWRDGTPPRRYKFLGIIDDERGSGWIPMGAMLEDVANEVKECGGDAAIQVETEFKMTGVYVPKDGGIARPVGTNYTKFQVIRYL